MDIALCLFRVFPHGGLQKDFLKVAKKALAMGHRVTCYTMDWQGEKLKDLNLVLLPQKALSNHAKCWKFAKALEKILCEKKHDKVLGFNRLLGLDAYFAGDLCFQASARKNHPILSHLLPRYRTFIALEKAVFDPTAQTKIFLLNPREKLVYQHYYHTPDERFHNIPPEIEIPEVWLSKEAARKVLNLPIPEEAHWLLMVGRDLKLKGCDRNLKALASLPQALKQKTFLLVVGEQGRAYFQKMARELGIEKQVLFLGARSDVPLLMQASDLLLHPAYKELAGMVLIEALVNGLPVLTTENCGYAFHIVAAKAGRVLPAQPFSSEAYAEAIQQMLENSTSENYAQMALAYTKTQTFSGMAESVLNSL